jgi:hypothetical protein
MKKILMILTSLFFIGCSDTEFIGNYKCDLNTNNLPKQDINNKFLNMDKLASMITMNIEVKEDRSTNISLGKKSFNGKWISGDDTFITLIGKENKETKLVKVGEQYELGKKFICKKAQ